MLPDKLWLLFHALCVCSRSTRNHQEGLVPVTTFSSNTSSLLKYRFLLQLGGIITFEENMSLC